jgi:nucleoside-diphosphate-sugar epimerase
MQQSESPRRALVVGASGITGWNVAAHLREQGWDVAGISRRPAEGLDGVTPVLVDITDREATASALAGGGFTHAFYCTWQRRDTEAENIAVNGAMIRNVLDALAPGGSPLRHVALITGLKHYMGPFEAYAKVPLDTPFREEQPRIDYPNFYYEQEDALFAAAARDGFTWSVHRSHTVIGWALGNAMNMGVTLAVYGTLCRELGRPFTFPGSPQQHDGITDLTDARLLAEQLEWAATTPAAANEAFNTANGDVFRWRKLWRTIGEELGCEIGEYPGRARSLVEEMDDPSYEDVWAGIVTKYDLRPTTLAGLVSWWHSEGDLCREAETFADTTKGRERGFQSFRRTDASFLAFIGTLREARIIPPAAR